METGNPEDIAASHGQITVIYVWASWLGPCIKYLDELYKVFEDSLAKEELMGKLQIHTVCIDDEKTEAENKIK